MIGLTLANIQPVLKVLYPFGLKKVLYENCPTLALMPKRTDLGGEYTKVPIMFSNSPTGSASDTVAFSNSVTGGPSLAAFQITPGYNYVKGLLNGVTMAASKGDKQAVISALKLTIDSMQNTMARSIANYLLGDGLGARGVIGAATNVATPNLVLADPDSVVNFEVGMVLELVSGGNVEAGTLTISAINRDTGVLTMSGNISAGVATAAVGDTVIRRGDCGDVQAVAPAAVQQLLPQGMDAWVPSTAPGATSFFGVNRSTDVTRLGGIRITGGGAPIEETLIKAAMRIYREGGKPNAVLMNPTDFGNLEVSLGSKVQYMRGKVQGSGDAGDIGFDTIRVHGPAGVIDVVAEPNLGQGRGKVVQWNTWTHWSVGSFPDFLMEDGNKLLRTAGNDSYEIRMGGYPQVSCSAPGYNADVTW